MAVGKALKGMNPGEGVVFGRMGGATFAFRRDLRKKEAGMGLRVGNWTRTSDGSSGISQTPGISGEQACMLEYNSI